VGYLAGIIDGEGSIQIGKQNGGKSWETLRVEVTTTNRELETFIQSTLKFGHVTTNKNPKVRGGLTWTWRCYGWNAWAFLKKIEPLLVIKGQSARIAIRFQSARSTAEFTRHFSNKMAEENHTFQPRSPRRVC